MSELTVESFGDASLIQQTREMRMLAQMAREDQTKDAHVASAASEWFRSVMDRSDRTHDEAKS